MKKIILTLLAFSMFLTVGCSEESATDYNETTPVTANIDPLAVRGTVWSGEIGVEDNGVYKVTADENALKADLNNTLKVEGYNTTVQTLSIIKLVSRDDPNDSGFMLIGSDGARTSIGVWLVRSGPQFFSDTSYTNSTTCSGCAQGCNLSYITFQGKKIAYCNENGCTYDCTKSESSM